MDQEEVKLSKNLEMQYIGKETTRKPVKCIMHIQATDTKNDDKDKRTYRISVRSCIPMPNPH